MSGPAAAQRWTGEGWGHAKSCRGEHVVRRPPCLFYFAETITIFALVTVINAAGNGAVVCGEAGALLCACGNTLGAGEVCSCDGIYVCWHVCSLFCVHICAPHVRGAGAEYFLSTYATRLFKTCAAQQQSNIIFSDKEDKCCTQLCKDNVSP